MSYIIFVSTFLHHFCENGINKCGPSDRRFVRVTTRLKWTYVELVNDMKQDHISHSCNHRVILRACVKKEEKNHKNKVKWTNFWTLSLNRLTDIKTNTVANPKLIRRWYGPFWTDNVANQVAIVWRCHKYDIHFPSRTYPQKDVYATPN